jgi:hypothetical protein
MESEEIIKPLVEIRDFLHEQLNDSRSAREEYNESTRSAESLQKEAVERQRRIFIVYKSALVVIFAFMMTLVLFIAWRLGAFR